jgi:hypothetical protein
MFMKNVNTSVATLGQELQRKSADLDSELKGLDTKMTETAQKLYEGSVSEFAFYILLAVFGAVFLLIMIVPRFYPSPVAENFLKTEFILQFSTVFVLIAAIIVLSIGHFIASDQVPVLLAGISGYVLGQLGSKPLQPSAPFKRPPATPP